MITHDGRALSHSAGVTGPARTARFGACALSLAALTLAPLGAGCELSDPGPDPTAGDEALVTSDAPRAEPAPSEADLDLQVRENTAFGFDMYDVLRREDPDENLFLSPYSISVALAMTHAGAAGETAEEMADTLGFVLPDDGHHEAFNALDRALERRPGEAGDGETLELAVANALWSQDEYPVMEPFLDTLAEHHGSGLRLLDFITEPEASREIINEWVSARTNERIPSLLPAGSIDSLTRFVLTNAIYLEADWLHQFEAEDTHQRSFTRLDGADIDVARMHQQAELPYADGDGYQVAVMPYVGESLSMVFVVPDEGRFEEIEGEMGAEALDEALAGTEDTLVELGLPQFEFSTDFDLLQPFRDLGMSAAFAPQQADFSGIDGGADPDLHITGVFHEAFVAVDEEGTEAAAATGVVGGTTSAPPEPEVTLHIDRPFLFFIVDEPTGTVLFLGRLLDPEADA